MVFWVLTPLLAEWGLACLITIYFICGGLRYTVSLPSAQTWHKSMEERSILVVGAHNIVGKFSCFASSDSLEPRLSFQPQTQAFPPASYPEFQSSLEPRLSFQPWTQAFPPASYPGFQSSLEPRPSFQPRTQAFLPALNPGFPSRFMSPWIIALYYPWCRLQCGKPSYHRYSWNN